MTRALRDLSNEAFGIVHAGTLGEALEQTFRLEQNRLKRFTERIGAIGDEGALCGVDGLKLCSLQQQLIRERVQAIAGLPEARSVLQQQGARNDLGVRALYGCLCDVVAMFVLTLPDHSIADRLFLRRRIEAYDLANADALQSFRRDPEL